MRWIYKTVHFELKKEGLLGSTFIDETEIEQELNDYGRSGWELISLMEVKDGLIGVLKQPLDEPSVYDEVEHSFEEQVALSPPKPIDKKQPVNRDEPVADEVYFVETPTDEPDVEEECSRPEVEEESEEEPQAIKKERKIGQIRIE